jgi:hypothetical protein
VDRLEPAPPPPHSTGACPRQRAPRAPPRRSCSLPAFQDLLLDRFFIGLSGIVSSTSISSSVSAAAHSSPSLSEAPSSDSGGCSFARSSLVWISSAPPRASVASQDSRGFWISGVPDSSSVQLLSIERRASSSSALLRPSLLSRDALLSLICLMLSLARSWHLIPVI